MTIQIWIIIALALLILATLGFYLTLYYRFTSFINQDKDRINAFMQCCYDNLYEETFGIVKEENVNNDISPVEINNEVYAKNVNDETSDEEEF